MAVQHSFHPHILREYDIRGQYGQTLFDADAYAWGSLFGGMLRQQCADAQTGRRAQIVVGRDGRLSSPALHGALIEGLLSQGVDVVDIGVGPTPMLSFAHYVIPSDAAIMVTGSHNPSDDNGFKMTFQHAPFFGEQITALASLSYQAQDQRGVLQQQDIQDAYVARLTDQLAIRPGTYVWDAGSGATGDILKRLLPTLPGTHYLLYGDLDGRFPYHHPDPTVEKNLDDLKAAVRSYGADGGFAFDGDGDRLGVVDAQGRVIWGDQTVILLARSVLSRCPGAPIIADVKASQVLFDDIQTHGGIPVMAKTGHSLIKSKMRALQAPLAGEMSGHIFIAEGYYGFDDALYAALRVLAALDDQGFSGLSDFYDQLPRVHNTPEIRLACSQDKRTIMAGVTRRLDQAHQSYDALDGVRVRTKEGWWGLRASNTQEVLTLRIEAQTPQALQSLCGMVAELLAPYDLCMSEIEELTSNKKTSYH